MNELERLRSRIDRIDLKILALLSQRTRVSREIGIEKIRLKIPFFQRTRLDEMLASRQRSATSLGLSPSFAKRVFKLIHDESLRIQKKTKKK